MGKGKRTQGTLIKKRALPLGDLGRSEMSERVVREGGEEVRRKKEKNPGVFY